VIKVLIADDEDLVRSGLRMILRNAGDIDVVAECDDGSSVVELVRMHRPHVVLLDVRMRETSGLETLRRMRKLPDPPKVAMLTTFDVDEYVSEALRLGAGGFLLKDTDPDQLVRAVRDLARGGAVLDPGVAARVLAAVADGERMAQPARALLDSLSLREREVLSLIGQGMSNAEIGGTLHLSEATVKGYVSAVLGKIGAVNRVQAALVAYRGGLVA
jgi:DNA-binding NarL/FixJ family response regulator